MLRSCMRNVGVIKSSYTGAAIRFISEERNQARAKELRDVKLIGTIYQPPLVVETGAKVLTIKTMNSNNNHYQVHRAVIKNQKMLSMIGDNLSLGQRVYLSGELRSKPFLNKDNKNHHRININVNELYATKPNKTTDTAPCTDYNSVFMLSHIVWDIVHYDESSRFCLSSTVKVRNPAEGGAETLKRELYNVYVHDRNLIDYVKNNVTRRDRVFVNGFLNYKPEIDENGAKAFSGYIEATKILKIDRFSEMSHENPIDEDIKYVNE